MRHGIAFAALLIALCLGLCGCRPLVEPQAQPLTVYATFYPIYALADAVTRDVPDVNLHCLVQPQDGCLRDYQLSDWDIYLLASANAVVSGGRGLESFEATLFGLGDAGPAVSAVLYNLELYNQGESAGGSDGESHLRGENPHLYMSIDGAGEIVQSTGAAFMSMDPRYAEEYAANVEAALSRLSDAAAQARAIMAPYAGRPVALMNEALIYAARDYGLEVADWIDRESGEGMYDDALRACVDRISESGAKVILIERQAPLRLIDALEDAGLSVARLDVFSTGREGRGFEHYIQAQLDNAAALRDAFERADSKGD